MNGSVTGAVRGWLRAEGLAALALSALIYGHSGLRWWIFFALLLTPDLSMLGYLLNARAGAAAYNIVHNYVLPLGLAAAAIALGRNDAVPYLCIWTAHIGLDRMLGYGLKYPSGFGETHLGTLRAQVR